MIQDFIYAPWHCFLAYMAQGWKPDLTKDGYPAFHDTHHGKYSILMKRDV